MSWGTRRRNTIVWVIILFITVPVVFYAYKTFYHAPTCFDGKKNGGEFGVDCGGSCELLCKADALAPIVLWTRYFTVSPGTYNALVYVENPNPDAGIDEIKYVFRLYDKDNILIQERNGVAKIPPKAVFPITENGLFTNSQIATRATFEFAEDFIWTRKEPQKPLILVRDENLLNSDTDPRVTAELQNITLQKIKDIEVVAILYDEEDNAVKSSTTFIEEMNKNEIVSVVFTWPAPFEMSISRVEIIPLYEASQ